MKSTIETLQTANTSMETQIEDLTKKLQEVSCYIFFRSKFQYFFFKNLILIFFKIGPRKRSANTDRL
jgi:hypothetical protein